MPHTAGHGGKKSDIRYIPILNGINIHALIVKIQENVNKFTILYNVFTIKVLHTRHISIFCGSLSGSVVHQYWYETYIVNRQNNFLRRNE